MIAATSSDESAAIPDVTTMRPPRPEVRNASFSSRIFAHRVLWPARSTASAFVSMARLPWRSGAVPGPVGRPTRAMGWGLALRAGRAGQQRELRAPPREHRLLRPVAPFEREQLVLDLDHDRLEPAFHGPARGRQHEAARRDV